MTLLSLGALDVQKYVQKRLTCVGIMININITIMVIQSCRFRASSERILATFPVTEVGLVVSPLRKDSIASVLRYTLNGHMIVACSTLIDEAETMRLA